MTALDALSAEKLRAELDPTIIGYEIIVLPEITSSNDFVFERTNETTPEGLVVFAERQTARADNGLTPGKQPPERDFGFRFSFDQRSTSASPHGLRNGPRAR